VPTAISYARAAMTDSLCCWVLIGTVVPTANAMLLAMATKLSGQSRPPSRECELRYPTANAVVC